MFTVRIVLKQDRPDIKGECQLMLCVTIDRKRVYKNTGFKIHPDCWNGKDIAKRLPNADMRNAKLNKMVSEVERELLALELEGEPITPQAARIILNPQINKTDFIAYSKTVLAEIKKTKSAGTYRLRVLHHKTLVKHSGSLTFSAITPVFLTKYFKYLTLECELQPNTAINHLKYIAVVFNHARAHGITTLYPFADWKIPSYREPQKDYLTLEECMSLYKLLESDHEPEIKKVCAFFLVECFAGIRVSDWGNFSIEKRLNADALKLRATKNNKDVYLYLPDYPILSQVIKYISDNNLVFSESPEHANRMLKVIAPLAGINKRLTSHVGRHTAATLHLEKGFSREAISEMLGISIKIVDTYAKFTGMKLRIESGRLGGF